MWLPCRRGHPRHALLPGLLASLAHGLHRGVPCPLRSPLGRVPPRVQGHSPPLALVVALIPVHVLPQPAYTVPSFPPCSAPRAAAFLRPPSPPPRGTPSRPEPSVGASSKAVACTGIPCAYAPTLRAPAAPQPRGVPATLRKTPKGRIGKSPSYSYPCTPSLCPAAPLCLLLGLRRLLRRFFFALRRSHARVPLRHVLRGD